MRSDRISIQPSWIVWTGISFSVVLLLISCSAQRRLPKGANDALIQHWASLPGSKLHEIRVLRAWPGELPQDVASEETNPNEVWCVETELSGTENDTAPIESVIWFVTKIDDQGDWTAVPLMTMSSIWPYQACGVVP